MMNKRMLAASRHGVALLVTLFFIMAITAVLGISLTLLQQGNAKSYEGRFLVQTSILLDDALSLLAASQEIAATEDAMTLRMLLEGASLIPFSHDGTEVLISMKSAMGRINVNTLADSEAFRNALGEYLVRYNVQDISYLLDLLADCMGGVQPYYKSDVFEYLPELYRDRIVDRRHFEQVLEFYVRMRRDNSVMSVPWDQLVRFGSKGDAVIDVNYVSPALWQLLLPDYSEDMTVTLSQPPMAYTALEETGLGEEVLKRLEPFGLSVYEPKVGVSIAIMQNEASAQIDFLYDLTSKTASEFTYGI